MCGKKAILKCLLSAQMQDLNSLTIILKGLCKALSAHLRSFNRPGLFAARLRFPARMTSAQSYFHEWRGGEGGDVHEEPLTSPLAEAGAGMRLHHRYTVVVLHSVHHRDASPTFSPGSAIHRLTSDRNHGTCLTSREPSACPR